MLFGLIVTNGEFGIATIKHVIMTWQQQLVIIHDISLFHTDSRDNRSTVYRCFKLVIGYLAYLLPFVVTGLALIYAGPVGSLQTICTKMNAPFLLNNSIPAKVNMTEMFQMRLKSDRTSCAMYGPYSMGEICEVYNFCGVFLSERNCFNWEFLIYN